MALEIERNPILIDPEEKGADSALQEIFDRALSPEESIDPVEEEDSVSEEEEGEGPCDEAEGEAAALAAASQEADSGSDGQSNEVSLPEYGSSFQASKVKEIVLFYLKSIGLSLYKM